MRKFLIFVVISFCFFISNKIFSENSNSTTLDPKTELLHSSLISNASDSDTVCQNKVMYMYITKAQLEKYTGNGHFLRMYIQFKTVDGRNFYGDSYLWLHGNAGYTAKHILVEDPSTTLNLGASSYVFGNLEIRKTDFVPVPKAIFYVFEPFIDQSSPEGINYVNYKITGYTLQDINNALPGEKINDFKDINEDEIPKLISILVNTLTAGAPAGQANPCPPKKPDPNQ
jgi:hypothetical protein